MKKSTDIEFLSNYWIEAKRLATHIKKNLHRGVTPNKIRYMKGSFVMGLIKYSELNNWDPKQQDGNSLTLKVLGDKLGYMIEMGRANDIEPMLRKIITGRTKRHYTHYSERVDYNNVKYIQKDFAGVGHFRWDFKAHDLNGDEIKRVKEFFKL